MNSKYAIVSAVVMGMSLGGCQALFGQRTAAIDSADSAVAAGEPALHPALDQGKQLLRAGRIAQAVELLRVAQRDPDSMADASNALGVAYAKLGRHDLADRYFRMALALEPGDSRYAANMLRLQRDYRMATRLREEEALMAAQSRKLDRQAKAEDVRPGQIERVSRGQVRIRTQSTPASIAPRMEVMAMHSSKQPDSSSDTAQDIEHGVMKDGEDSAPAKGSPATIDVMRSIPARSDATGRQNYPVRITFGA